MVTQQSYLIPLVLLTSGRCHPDLQHSEVTPLHPAITNIFLSTCVQYLTGHFFFAV